jgi:hypothetical protein
LVKFDEMKQASRTFYDLKVKLRKKIENKYGTHARFLKEHSELGINKHELSRHLNPQKGITMATLLKLCEACNVTLIMIDKEEAA